MKLEQSILLTMDRLLRGLRRRLRNFYYSRVLKSMGDGCQICDGVLITRAHTVSLGAGVYLNDGAVIQACEGSHISLGNYVTLSYGAKLLTGGLAIGNHGVNIKWHEVKPIVVEDGAWIGAGAIILPGVTVGRKAIVAAGSVVNRNVEANTIVGGVPAKFIRAIGAGNP